LKKSSSSTDELTIEEPDSTFVATSSKSKSFEVGDEAPAKLLEDLPVRKLLISVIFTCCSSVSGLAANSSRS